MKPVTPEDIERELQQLLAVEPSANFNARVRTAVANQPARSGVPWIVGGLAVTLCTVVFVAVFIYLSRPAADTPVASTPGQEKSVDASPAPDVVPATAPAEVSRARDRVFSVIRAQRDSREPSLQVLVSPDDQQAFERLVRGTTDGTVALSFEETTQKLTMAELTIAPITTETFPIAEQQGVVQ
jgi:hypothetical protein